MRRSPSFKDVAGELANDESQVWPIEVDSIRLIVMTEKRFYELLEKAGYEAEARLSSRPPARGS